MARRDGDAAPAQVDRVPVVHPADQLRIPTTSTSGGLRRRCGAVQRVIRGAGDARRLGAEAVGDRVSVGDVGEGLLWRRRAHGQRRLAAQLDPAEDDGPTPRHHELERAQRARLAGREQLERDMPVEELPASLERGGGWRQPRAHAVDIEQRQAVCVACVSRLGVAPLTRNVAEGGAARGRASNRASSRGILDGHRGLCGVCAYCDRRPRVLLLRVRPRPRGKVIEASVEYSAIGVAVEVEVVGVGEALVRGREVGPHCRWKGREAGEGRRWRGAARTPPD
eukprot:scaffold97024_cov26-Tisochrysis_lutea.AAC.1